MGNPQAFINKTIGFKCAGCGKHFKKVVLHNNNSLRLYCEDCQRLNANVSSRLYYWRSRLSQLRARISANNPKLKKKPMSLERMVKELIKQKDN